MKYELRCRHHPSGRNYLEERIDSGSYDDVRDEQVWGELDKTKFFKAVAQYIERLKAEGHTVIFPAE